MTGRFRGRDRGTATVTATVSARPDPEDRQVWFPPYEPTAPNLIAATVADHGSRTAAILDESRLSYADLAARSAALAKGLLATGHSKGSRVGLLAPNGPDWIVAWLAAARIGAVVSLLNTYYKARELEWVLRHCDAETLLCRTRHLDHDYEQRLEQCVPDLAGHTDPYLSTTSHPLLRRVWMWGDPSRPWAGSIDHLVEQGRAISDEQLAAVEAEVSPADPMVVVYSSGSTTEPKGAIHSQGSVVRHAHNLWQFRDLAAGQVLYTPMPLFWIGGLSFTLMGAIHAGATLVFEDRFDPGATLELIERERITHVMGWPHMAKALQEHPDFATRDLSSIEGGLLHGLLPGHEQVPVERIANSLGMTETLGPHTLEVMGSELPADKAGSFGRSAPGLEHRVVDPLTGAECAVGDMGEIWVRGYAVMQGLHRVEREDVFTTDGWYRTGDGGYLDADGHLFFRGRMGSVIKSAGTLVTPREVELVIEEFPEVMHAFVMGVPHADRGEDVAVAVVLRPDTDIDPDELRSRVKDQLSSYKVPRHVATFADQNDLPWLDSGKIDLRAVGALLADRFAD